MDILKNGHQLSITCLCIDSKSKYLYSGSKDGAIVKWCLQGKRLIVKVPGIGKSVMKIEKKNRKGKKSEEDKNKEEEDRERPAKKHKSSEDNDQPDFRHNRHVYGLAMSHDDKFLVSGGYDRVIRVWDPSEMNMIHAFTGHLNEITGLVFRKGYHQLYSSSLDRTVKLWNLEDDNFAFVESLFGHETGLTSIHALEKERVITSGGRDSSIRVWKIVEEAQTVFETSHGSVDIVKFIDQRHFVSGGEDGLLCLWNVMKRKPILVQPHKKNSFNREKTENISNDVITNHDVCNWIVSIATFTRGIGGECLIATGSSDSSLKIWKLESASRGPMNLVREIQIDGFINCLEFTRDGKKLAVGVGQEHRFGRWWKIREARNAVHIITLDIELKFGKNSTETANGKQSTEDIILGGDEDEENESDEDEKDDSEDNDEI